MSFQSSFIMLDTFASDEGVVLVAAEDVANGKLLYRDVYVPVTPTVYLLEGLVFKLLGSEFWVSRLLAAALYAAIVVATFAVASICLPLGFATIAGVLTIPLEVWMWPHAQFFTYTPLAILFCVLSIALAWRLEQSPRRVRSAIYLGLALGFALWVKPNLGGAVGAGVLFYWLSAWLRSRMGLACMRPRSFATLFGEGLSVLLGVFIVTAVHVAYLVANGILVPMTESLLALGRIYGDVPQGLFPSLWPPFGQHDAIRNYPDLIVPGMFNGSLLGDLRLDYLMKYTGWIDFFVRLVYFTPIGLYFISAVALLEWIRRGSWSSRREAALLIWLTGVCLLLTIIPHPAVHYLTPTLITVIVLGAFLVSEAQTSPYRRLRVATLAASGIGACVFLAASVGLLSLYIMRPRTTLETPAGTLWQDPRTTRLLEQILDYSRENIPEDEAVFVAPYYPLYYYLTKREHPSRFIDLRPGSPGREFEDEIILELERAGVEHVLYMKGSQYAGIERFENAYPRLHHYMIQRFEHEKSFDSFFGPYGEFRRRKSDAHRDAQPDREP
jgi:hypothetical protein